MERQPRVWTMSPRLASDNQRFPLDCYLYHESLGFAILAITKTGCSAAKRWLISMVEPEVLERADLDVHKYCLDRFALCALRPAESDCILAHTPILSFIRNPAERLRSSFVDKHVRPPVHDLFEPSREVIEDIARGRGMEFSFGESQAVRLGNTILSVPASSDVDYERGITFREFVEYVCAAPPDHLDPHWRPQSAFLLNHRVDCLVRLDSMNLVLDHIAAARGRPATRAINFNVTRKEQTHRSGLCDVHAGELRRLDLRPPLEQLADSSILERIARNHDPCWKLYEKSRRTFHLGLVQALLERRVPGPAAAHSPTIEALVRPQPRSTVSADHVQGAGVLDGD